MWVNSVWAGCAAGLLLAGCATPNVFTGPSAGGASSPRVALAEAAPQSNDCIDLSAQGEMSLRMIGRMIDEGALYAALAHLDGLPTAAQSSPLAHYYRAEVLRRTHRHAAALPIYGDLAQGCLAGLGHHGLGLIAAEDKDWPRALAQLHRARELRPTDGRIRNDLGYTYLLQGRRSEAKQELSTALELGAGRRAIMNMLLLLSCEGRMTEMQRYARQAGVQAHELNQLGYEAERMCPRAQAVAAP